MMNSLRLVVDADVATSAANSSKRLAKTCKDVLVTIDRCGHVVGGCDHLFMQWNSASPYGRAWRQKMLRRGRWKRLGPMSPNPTLIAAMSRLRQNINQHCSGDIHLILSANSLDKVIISRDKKAKSSFRFLASEVSWIAEICWVNAVMESPSCEEVLASGSISPTDYGIKPRPI